MGDTAIVGESLAGNWHGTTPCRVLLVFLGLVLLSIPCRAASPSYSKTVQLPALRVSFAELQGVVAKAASLMASANSGTGVALLIEETRIRQGDFEVDLPGHSFEPSGIRLPTTADRFYYRAVTRDQAPINQVNMDFSDFTRSLSVEGASPDQVDAVFSALRDDLFRSSSLLGGYAMRTLITGFLRIGFLFSTGILAVLWFQSGRKRQLCLPLIFSAACLFLVIPSPFGELFAGFSMVRGDASFIVRYSPHMTFGGLVATILGMLISYALSRPRVSPNSGALDKRLGKRSK